MALTEFAMIARYFSNSALSAGADDIILGIGDDAAVLEVPQGQQLVVAADTLVESVHFPAASAGELVGFRALATNLSDMAAMGAQPRWYTLCLTAPKLDPAWLESFCRGLAGAAAGTGVSLVGGDTTAGPLSVSIQIMGLVATGTALTRSGAQPGDAIYVTGSLGDAAAGLELLQAEKTPARQFDDFLRMRFSRPQPRLQEAALLRGMATSCIDISDGLLADLGHICECSSVGARLELDAIPVSAELFAYAGKRAHNLATSGGDDYELCFTVPAHCAAQLEKAFQGHGLHITRIGTVVARPGIQCFDSQGKLVESARSGFQHFAD